MKENNKKENKIKILHKQPQQHSHTHAFTQTDTPACSESMQHL